LLIFIFDSGVVRIPFR